MEEPNSVDHLNSSLTDLMTSLMVIFILLLLVFVHRTAGKDAAVTDVLLKTTAPRHEAPGLQREDHSARSAGPKRNSGDRARPFDEFREREVDPSAGGRDSF